MSDYQHAPRKMSADPADRGMRAGSRDARLDVPSALELSRGLSEVLDQLRASHEVQYELIRGIGHDFKSPLASATLLARALTTGQFGPLNADQAEAIATLNTSLGHLMHLADAIYTAASARAQTSAIANETPCDLAQIVHSAVAAHQISADIRGIELTAITPAEAFVRCDDVRLRRMVDNLVSNAVKFTDSGSVELAVQLTGAERVTLTVRDTGIGIPAGDLDEIGTNFRRGTNAQDRPGTGVGIAVVRRLVAEVGGTFELSSTLGVGTVAALTLLGATPSTREA